MLEESMHIFVKCKQNNILDKQQAAYLIDFAVDFYYEHSKKYGRVMPNNVHMNPKFNTMLSE